MGRSHERRPARARRLDRAAPEGALPAFTRGPAQELAPRGIRVNAVAPGPIWSPLIPVTVPEDQVAPFGSRITPGLHPASTRPPPGLHPASQEAGCATGERIAVTGGTPVP